MQHICLQCLYFRGYAWGSAYCIFFLRWYVYPSLYTLYKIRGSGGQIFSEFDALSRVWKKLTINMFLNRNFTPICICRLTLVFAQAVLTLCKMLLKMPNRRPTQFSITVGKKFSVDVWRLQSLHTMINLVLKVSESQSNYLHVKLYSISKKSSCELRLSLP